MHAVDGALDDAPRLGEVSLNLRGETQGGLQEGGALVVSGVSRVVEEEDHPHAGVVLERG